MIILPTRIHLTAMDRRWKVSYNESPGKLIVIEHSHGELGLYGKHYTKSAALHLVLRWVRLKAHNYLAKLLDQLNKKVKVKYKKLIVGSHEAQWGSYSSSKTISLNYKLIFLPKPLVKHIIYHELCHVNNLSHSEKFWKEVGKYDRNWKKNKAAMNEADSYIPEWVIF